MRRGEPLLDRPRWTGRSTTTPPRCYYEKVYIQGGNLLDARPQAMGSTRVLGRAPRVRRPTTATSWSRPSTLLDALDDATPIDLGASLFAPRFPPLY